MISGLFKFLGGSPHILWMILLAVAGCVALVNMDKRKSKELEETITLMNQEIERAKLQLNDSVALYQAKMQNLTMTKKNVEARYNELLKASKVRSKDVSRVTEVVSVIHDVDTVVAYVDSFGGISARLVDPYTHIDVEILPDKNAIIDYEMKDSLIVMNVQKKHSWLFGLIKWKEHKETRVINMNPKAEIVGLEVIDVFE